MKHIMGITRGIVACCLFATLDRIAWSAGPAESKPPAKGIDLSACDLKGARTPITVSSTVKPGAYLER